jgi:molecular chaperone DnaK
MTDLILGIDLGTTNSVVALTQNSQTELIKIDQNSLMPSVVGFTADDQLLIGQTARNQYHLYPNRTISSIKRKMGEETLFDLEVGQFTAVEISSMILRRLKIVAEHQLRCSINRAVITVPAYFNDAQRTATKEAGEIAGFIVERIINEPTAAAIAYLNQQDINQNQLFLVYDLGGGTFDVSVVKSTDKITEILSSHGNTQLGGDDFDKLLYEWFRSNFMNQHQGADPSSEMSSRIRLLQIAEATKIKLSTQESVEVLEEYLMTVNGVALHLDLVCTRLIYEDLINPLVQKTRDSVQIALKEAKVLAEELDLILLVGGSVYTPLIQKMLSNLLNKSPQISIDPDKAVALGAASHAARIAGDQSQKILLDVSPFTFGTVALGEVDGNLSSDCYVPIIYKNHPLPTRKIKAFSTLHDGQESVEVSIYHGDNQKASGNTLLGSFMVEGLDLNAFSGNPIDFELTLDLNGILNVKVVENITGLSKKVEIKDAFRKLSNEEQITARQRMITLFSDQYVEWDFLQVEHSIESVKENTQDDENESYIEMTSSDFSEVEISHTLTKVVPFSDTPPQNLSEADKQSWSMAFKIYHTAHQLINQHHQITESDQNEIKEIMDQLAQMISNRNFEQVSHTIEILEDLIFYLEV